MEQIITLKTVQKVIGLEETVSTQTLAKSLAATETDGTLILACRQTGALGNNGKEFYAGEGGVYFTLILHPGACINTKKLTVSKLSKKLTLAMSNAISDVITNVLHIHTKITKNGELCAYDKSARKWKKCAGILAEKTDNGRWLLGAGIYLNNRLPISQRTECISLKSILNSETSKELFLDELLSNFWKEYAFL